MATRIFIVQTCLYIAGFTLTTLLLCFAQDKTERSFNMSDHVYKVIELVGSSSKSSDDAIQQAVDKASKSLHNLDWFEVVETRGHIADGKVGHYQVKIKVGFRLD